MHKMSDHTTIEEVIKHSLCWEDMDSWLIIGVTEDNQIVVDEYWRMDFNVKGSSLLDILQKLNPKCYCDENDR